MAMKNKYDAKADIPAAHVGEYVERDGAWYLDVEGGDDTGALKRALDHERAQTKAAQTKAAGLQAAADAAETARLKATGDIEAITASYEAKIATAAKEAKERQTGIERQIKRAAIDAAATKLAGEISTVPALMRRAIADRLYVDIVDDVPLVRVFGPDGKASALNMDDLRKEFVATPDYASILLASKATGGGAGSNAKPNGGVPGSAGPKKISEMTELERRELHGRDRDAFNRQVQAEQAAAAA